jgi:hypothetical protein
MNIVAHSYIDHRGLYLNGELLLDLASEAAWEKKAYQHLGIDYPKFYKMDSLSKLAFIATEVLASHFYPDYSNDNRMQLIFANRHCSLQTDNKFVDSYREKGAPSPSLFVYTLPNILTGELCIRHKIYGENCFYIDNEFNPEAFSKRLHLAATNGNIQSLCGWVDGKSENNQECFIFLVSHTTQADIGNELLTTYKLYKNE